MSSLLDLLKDNWDKATDAPLALLVILLAATLLAYRLAAWHQAGEAKNLREQKAALEAQLKSHSTTAVAAAAISEGSSAGAAFTSFHLRRQAVHWGPYNDQVRRRFWVAGTSLVGVVERDLVATFYGRGVRDIKVVLPSTDVDTLSYRQLHLFDAQPTGSLVLNQVEVAGRSFEMLARRVAELPESAEHQLLRRYTGIMYANIAVFDDDAFVAFYDTTGLGDNSPTLHFNARTSGDGYSLAIDEFMRMWKARPELGLLPNKVRGCSMIFTRSDGSILLYRRDNKSNIPYPNCWDLLGGHVEPGESPEEAIVRELEEEIEYRLDRPALFRAVDLPDRVEYVFWKDAALEIGATRLHEGQHLRWFSAREIADLQTHEVAFDFKPILQHFLSARSVRHARVVDSFGARTAP
jgi:8-oxo-dGTP diphosphatase